MHDVTREGRTVVFVSHNLAAVRSLCTAGARCSSRGGSSSTATRTRRSSATSGGAGGRRGRVVEGERLEERIAKSPALRRGAALPLHAHRRARRGGRCRRCSFRSDEEITVAVDYTVLRPVPSLRLLVTLTDANQARRAAHGDVDDPELDGPLRARAGRLPLGRSSCRAGLLGDARLDLNVSLIAEVNQVLDYAAVAELEVRFAGHGANTRGKAYLRPQLPWRTEALSGVEAT